MASLKELQYGRRLEDLNKYFEIDLKKENFRQLVNVCAKLRKAADEHSLIGDEELAYIQLMKYFNILDHISKMSEFKRNKQYVQENLGCSERLMEKLETLQNSLSRRYAELNNRALVAKEATEISYALEPTSSANGTANNTIDFNSKFISCAELYKFINEVRVLVVDCRPSADYATSRLKYKWTVNVPEEILTPGMSAGKLQEKLDPDSRSLWAARAVKDQVVLIDWLTGAENEKDAKIYILLDILKNWDPDTVYRAPIKLLQGGYECFITMYPIMVTNPRVQAPRKNNNNLYEDMDTIEYPSLNEVNINIQTRASNKQPPAIDRSSKLSAIKTYKEKDSTITDLEKDQNTLMNRARITDEDIKTATSQLEDLVHAKRMRRDDNDVIFNVLELQVTTKDNELENQRLRKQLEHIDRNRGLLTPYEAQQINNIKTKIREREAIDFVHKTENDKRELLLKEAHKLRKQNINITAPIAIPNATISNGTTFVPAELSSPTMPMFPMPYQPLQTIGSSSTLKQPKRTLDEDKENNILATHTLPPKFDRAKKPTMKTLDTTTYVKVRDFSSVLSRNVRPGLTGLQNLGNTCFMNSILQCLSHTEHLTKYCVSGKYKSHINCNNRTRGAIIEEVAELLKVLWSGNYKSVACKDFCHVIGQYHQMFRGSEQQDAHEFLTILVDLLHSDLQTLNTQTSEQDNLSPAERSWLEFTNARESCILHWFYGQIKSTVKCQSCENESSTYECFSNLSLELPSPSSMSYIEDCLDMYFRIEPVNGWHCPNCNQKRSATKKLSIFKLPPVLVIHFKRFYAVISFSGGEYRKKQDLVRFPLENLDLRPYLADTDLPPHAAIAYDLYGVSNHYGTMESGHYTAFCRNRNNWFKFDDPVVTELHQSAVNSSGAYILFYTWSQHSP